MNFTWLLPSALAALAAIALPLLIHLSRRSEHKPTDFAALRWLSAHRRPQRKWLLQERVLLAIRILLLIALAVFLAQAVRIKQAKPVHWVVVIPGAKPAGVNNLPAGKNVEWHWLSPGYPLFEQPLPSSTIALSSLLRELDSQLPKTAELTILAPEKLAGLDGERMRISRKVNWLITPGEMKLPDSAKPVKSVKFSIRYDAAHAKNVMYFQAAQRSWQSDKNKSIAADATLLSDVPPSKDTVLVWLASGKLPPSIVQWLQQGGTLIAAKELTLPAFNEAFPVWRDAQGAVILRESKMARGRILQWQVPLSPSAMPLLLSTEFPDHLFSILRPKSESINSGFALQQTPEKSAMLWPERPEPLWPWLLWAIVFLFIVERWFSGRKKAWAST